MLGGGCETITLGGAGVPAAGLGATETCAAL